jgi:hypothetical protein
MPNNYFWEIVVRTLRHATYCTQCFIQTCFRGEEFPPLELRNSPRIFLDISLHVTKIACCTFHSLDCNTDNILIHTVHDGTWKRMYLCIDTDGIMVTLQLCYIYNEFITYYA